MTPSLRRKTLLLLGLLAGLVTLPSSAQQDKRVRFANPGQTSLVVKVYEYDNPDDPPGAVQSAAVFPGGNSSSNNTAAGLRLAEGCYSFCVYWKTGQTDNLGQIIYAYRFVGDLPANPAICLDERTSTMHPPVVSVSAGYPYVGSGVGSAGQCPAPEYVSTGIPKSTWTTSYGPMRFTGNTTGLLARYGEQGGEDGRIVGTLTNTTLDGYWIEPNSSHRCDTPREGSYYWGRFIAQFTSPNAFKASWSYCAGAPSRTWNGSR